MFNKALIGSRILITHFGFLLHSFVFLLHTLTQRAVKVPDASVLSTELASRFGLSVPPILGAGYRKPGFAGIAGKAGDAEAAY